eukprot:686138-Rhodomonas_salina.3
MPDIDIGSCGTASITSLVSGQVQVPMSLHVRYAMSGPDIAHCALSSECRSRVASLSSATSRRYQHSFAMSGTHLADLVIFFMPSNAFAMLCMALTQASGTRRCLLAAKLRW